MRTEWVKEITRVVLKLGTGILTDSRKRPDREQFHQLVAQVNSLRRTGRDPIVVTSGAVGAGMGVLGYEKRPATLAELQACAAVGQSRLMAMYEELFGTYGLAVAQVLLTHEDLEHHERHLNARNTLVELLRKGVIPIINENDAVSVTELKFGDNDRLSALVACLLPADLLIILTTADGLVEGFGTPAARVVSTVHQIDSRIEAMAGGTSSATAVGGMATKLHAARVVVRSGIPMVIAGGRQSDVVARILEGEEVGTWFVAHESRLASRKRWIAFFHHPKGTLWVDNGAKQALLEGKKSLLAPGITRCDGDFHEGDVVRICDLEGTEFARGLAAFDAPAVADRAVTRAEVISRDDLVIL